MSRASRWLGLIQITLGATLVLRWAISARALPVLILGLGMVVLGVVRLRRGAVIRE